MKEKLEKILDQALAEIGAADAKDALEAARIKYLGKKGELTAILRGMGQLSAEERPVIGQVANEIRAKIESAIDEAGQKAAAHEMERRLQRETLDVTLPGKKITLGKKHPLTTVLDEVTDIFTGMGYSVAEGPEVELVHYNFDMLNAPKTHPSREPQDTFYIDPDIVLRTQTSPMQARVMEKTQPPIRIIAPGRVFRNDEVDATHSPMFHQIEGLVIDKNVTMGDLKGTLEVFAKELYGEETTVRFRPSYFPFTEPSAEMDISCFKCHGKGCPLCKYEGYIEILGCGMVHPNVLRACGIDPEVYSGFAFGVGLERITLFRYKIDDMRLLFENDERFLSQF
ncbi:MAG: phenylalanine--tRNA ligase subunit alpha [Clostridia bacterium]|nr:phenylalanine--tRNA ligase subunit alpha [Clostridia bacterium]MDD7671790.1 phenylalanine--tRNA ligase subunit alpha [Clostridia bacterium]MDY2929045.1 phenylalanine--tRNA ligase subunit alpha [Clostridiaceae bacterium]